MNNVTININFSDEQIDYWLSGAFEGGSNYWCESIEVKDNDYKGCKYASECVSKGGTIIVTLYDECEEKAKITKKDISNALAWMSENKYTKCLDRLLNDKYDADDSDVIFQVACFGKVIYG